MINEPKVQRFIGNYEDLSHRKPVFLVFYFFVKNNDCNCVILLFFQHLVLKLWSKTESSGSQVLGFTTIDLRPLLAGMPNLSGWYNIVDFTGLCQGQIKCGVTPITPVGRRDDIKDFCSPRNPTPPKEKVCNILCLLLVLKL